MSGWEKVAAATVVAVVGLVMLNLAIWRRMRDATQSAAQIERYRERNIEP